MSREIIFLLDRSSNMAGKEAEVIAEYNAFLLQNGRGDYNVTTVLFDDQYVLLYYCLPIGYAQLYPEQYYVRGACALYDAIGRTITTVNDCHAQLAESKRPKTYLFIRTNGGDNASLTYTKKMIWEMLERQQQKCGWEIFFVGCDVQTALAAAPTHKGINGAEDSQDDDYFDILRRLLERRNFSKEE